MGKTSNFCQSNTLQSAACSYMINAGIGAAGKRKKRSPGIGKRFKKAFKKTWKQVVKNPIKKINRELIERPIEKLKCARLVRKTIGMNLRSSGTVKIGINLGLQNLDFVQDEDSITLSFTPSFNIIGQIVSWNLDERKARKKIEESMRRTQDVKLPAVIQKVEKKLQTKIGQT